MLMYYVCPFIWHLGPYKGSENGTKWAQNGDKNTKSLFPFKIYGPSEALQNTLPFHGKNEYVF